MRMNKVDLCFEITLAPGLRKNRETEPFSLSLSVIACQDGDDDDSRRPPFTWRGAIDLPILIERVCWRCSSVFLRYSIETMQFVEFIFGWWTSTRESSSYCSTNVQTAWSSHWYLGNLWLSGRILRTNDTSGRGQRAKIKYPKSVSTAWSTLDALVTNATNVSSVNAKVHSSVLLCVLFRYSSSVVVKVLLSSVLLLYTYKHTNTPPPHLRRELFFVAYVCPIPNICR